MKRAAPSGDRDEPPIVAEWQQSVGRARHTRRATPIEKEGLGVKSRGVVYDVVV